MRDKESKECIDIEELRRAKLTKRNENNRERREKLSAETEKQIPL